MRRAANVALLLGLAGAASTCGPKIGEAPAACTPLRQGGLTCEARRKCAACFSIDATTGIGSCRGVLANVTVDEMAAALAFAVSTDDRWQTECPGKNDHLVVVADSAGAGRCDADIARRRQGAVQRDGLANPRQQRLPQ